jgi:DNA-binding transcriptional ArsR family regulator
MAEPTGVESTTLTHRVVLLGVAELSGRDDVPAHAGEIVSTCIDNIDGVEGDVLGRVSEADVARALNELEDAGLVDRAEVGDTSAVGKGRPAYVLPMGADQLCAALADDTRLEALVEHVRAVCE